MVNATACRACLATNVPFKMISDTPLQLVYETLTDSHLIQPNKPSKLCRICHALLQQIYNFTSKAVKANLALDQMILKGVMLSQSHFDSAMRTLNRKLFDVIQLSYTNIQTITLDPVYPESSNNIVIAVGNVTTDTGLIKMEVPVEIHDGSDSDDVEDQDTNNQSENEISDTEYDPLDTFKDSMESQKEAETQTGTDIGVLERVKEIPVKKKDDVEEDTNNQSEIEISDTEYDPLESATCTMDTFRESTESQKEAETQTGMDIEILEREKEIPVKVKRKKKGKLKVNPNYNPNLIAINTITREISIPYDQQIKEFHERALSINYVNSPYKCEICFTGFKNSKTLENHRIRHDKISGPFECEICRVRYPRPGRLRTHNRNTHQRLLECLKCSLKSRTDEQARQHEKWHTGYTYNCSLCGLAFNKITSYLTHKRKNHYNEYICTWCGECFISNNGLKMHKVKTHQGKEPRKILLDPDPLSDRFCKECNAQFATKEAWQRHMFTALVHTRPLMSVQCRICSETLESPEAMLLHMRQHDTEKKTPVANTPKKFICNECGKSFPNRDQIRQHITRVHINKGVEYHKIVVCEVCGLKCRSNAALVVHQRIHTGQRPYKCDRDNCNKEFRHPLNLKIHLRTHTGEKPYACSECDLRFNQRVGLKRHKLVHTGEKPYSCELCNKRFTQSNSRKAHILTVHHKVPVRRRRRHAKGRQITIEQNHVEVK